MVSTDKAVNPSNVMGASKQLLKYVQSVFVKALKNKTVPHDLSLRVLENVWDLTDRLFPYSPMMQRRTDYNHAS
jgi:hypothetical protein